MRRLLVAVVLVGLSAGGAQAQQGYKVGDRVSCSGYPGTIIRVEPRAGWPADDPFFIVNAPGTTTNNEIKCLARDLKGGPEAPAPKAPVPASAPAKAPAVAAPRPTGPAPDGTYRCHKISPGGQLMDIGNLTVRGGRGTLAGMPSGWTVRGTSLLPRDSQGKIVVAFDYTSAAGWNDRLDCVAR